MLKQSHYVHLSVNFRAHPHKEKRYSSTACPTGGGVQNSKSVRSILKKLFRTPASLQILLRFEGQGETREVGKESGSAPKHASIIQTHVSMCLITPLTTLYTRAPDSSALYSRLGARVHCGRVQSCLSEYRRDRGNCQRNESVDGPQRKINSFLVIILSFLLHLHEHM